MQGPYPRRRGRSATFDFDLFELDGINARENAIHVAGDTKIIKDGGADANTTNGFFEHGGSPQSYGYDIVLTDSEMQADRIHLPIRDQTVTKIWLDTSLIIETFEPPGLLQATDIATLTSQDDFTLAEGSTDDDAYNGMLAIITDATTLVQKCVGVVFDYVGSTKQVILAYDPAVFTISAGDYIDIMAQPLGLGMAAGTIEFSDAKSGTLSTTEMSTNLTEATDDHYIGRTIIWLTGVLFRQASDCTDYTGVNGVLKFSAVTEAPSAGDKFVIV